MRNKVLIYNEENTIDQRIIDSLKDKSYQVDEANSTLQFLDKINNNEYQSIFVDSLFKSLVKDFSPCEVYDIDGSDPDSILDIEDLLA